MKTTLDIKDDLPIRAKKLAKHTGRPPRAVLEESLRHTLSQADQLSSYEVPDVSFGDANADDPLEALTWQDLRQEIYRVPDSR